MQEDVFGLVGSTIDDRYRIDTAIGSGGFGVVYRAWHLNFDHAIAVKCLQVPYHFTADQQRLFLESFRNEGKLLSALSGRNLGIVRVYDFGITTGRYGAPVPYLILEWLVGRDLEAALVERLEAGRGAYSENEAIALLRPAVEALASAHLSSPPIVHCDVKPANLYVVEREGRTSLKVLDFGIAKVMQDGVTATQLATRATSPSYSPAWGAPEQFHPGSEGYGRTGPWTDVHALGLVLVELLTGKRALDGSEHYALGASATSALRPTPRVRGVDRLVSDGLEAICSKALALRPRDRYRNAGELLEALDALKPVTRSSPSLPNPQSSRAPSATSADATPSIIVSTFAAPDRGQPFAAADPSEPPRPPSRPFAAQGPTQLIAPAAQVTQRTETKPVPGRPHGDAALPKGLLYLLGPATAVLLSAGAMYWTGDGKNTNQESTEMAIATAQVPKVHSRYDVTSTPGVVSDTLRGLHWQRMLPSTYEGCTGQYRPNNGNVGDACTWAEAKRYCENLSLTGQTGLRWRLPTKDEQESIVDLSKHGAAIDQTIFPSTPGHFFWSATPHDGYGSAWSVGFGYGRSFFNEFNKTYRVRCVC